MFPLILKRKSPYLRSTSLKKGGDHIKMVKLRKPEKRPIAIVMSK